MRSVVIHLVNTTRDEVRTRLTQFAQAEHGDRWLYPPEAPQPSLYIEFYEDYERELEADELARLKSALGQKPEVTVIADISGRVPGDNEVRAFIECLLSAFRGVAQDEYSHHWWSLAEICSGAKPEGNKFFDYEGWYRSTSTG